MVLLRRMIGDVLRRHRLRQSRTLRDVSVAAGVSLGYLSEVERGRKEASSELLAAICGALDVSLAEVLREVSDDLAREERRRRVAPVGFGTAPGFGTAAALGTPAVVRPVAGVAPLVPSGPQRTQRPQRPGARPATPVASLHGLSVPVAAA
jgi:transcriptional regulator with XRE-family HTH domain